MNDKTLHAVTKSSALFSFADREAKNVELVLPMPTPVTDWMLLLKISCLEGNELAMHPKHYGMKVEKTGD